MIKNPKNIKIFFNFFSFFIKYEVAKIKIKKPKSDIKAEVLTPRANARESDEKYKLGISLLKYNASEQINSAPVSMFVCMLGIWTIIADKEEKI